MSLSDGVVQQAEDSRRLATLPPRRFTIGRRGQQSLSGVRGMDATGDRRTDGFCHSILSLEMFCHADEAVLALCRCLTHFTQASPALRAL
jgi:hypothetical protein